MKFFIYQINISGKCEYNKNILFILLYISIISVNAFKIHNNLYKTTDNNDQITVVNKIKTKYKTSKIDKSINKY